MTVRVGVVGVGAIGRQHARIYATLEGAELVGVYDTDAARAREVAGRYDTRVHATLESLLEAADAVTVAVPTPDHHEVGLRCLDAGCDLLLEKPIATTLAQADELLRRAAAGGRVLQVGHVERYNPAVEAILPEVEEPRFIEVHRLGSFVERSLEVDVVLDLMIHDLDILHTLVPGQPTEIRAVGVPVLSSEVDIANARLEMESGCIVNMTASRVSMSRVRKVRIFQPEAYFSVDYSSQEVACFRLRREPDGRASIAAQPIHVRRGEPLARELEEFVVCVRERRPPRVDGAAGRRALATALRVREQVQSGLERVVGSPRGGPR